tara:strand:- start:589 stop:1461 length:873 start_codon:yes stop_codon:yes gene_type:complete
MKKNDDSDHSSNLLDIVRGYSVLNFSDKEYYFRHFLFVEILELDEMYKADIKKSVKKGIEKEEKLIKNAIKLGSWTIREEEEIKSLKWTIKKSTSALSKIKDVNQRSHFNNQIKSDTSKLNILNAKRNGITSYSAESLAEIKKVQRMVDKCLFFDSNFKDKIGDDISTGLTSILFSRYAELNSKECVLGASYKGGFFDIFAAQSRNPLKLFDATFNTLTIFQKNLITLSTSLLNKMKNVRIPDEIADDPIKILDYEEKEDVDTKVSHGVDDLKLKMKARGGKLKAEDFLS